MLICMKSERRPENLRHRRTKQNFSLINCILHFFKYRFLHIIASDGLPLGGTRDILKRVFQLVCMIKILNGNARTRGKILNGKSFATTSEISASELCVTLNFNE